MTPVRCNWIWSLFRILSITQLTNYNMATMIRPVYRSLVLLLVAMAVVSSSSSLSAFNYQEPDLYGKLYIAQAMSFQVEGQKTVSLKLRSLAIGVLHCEWSCVLICFFCFWKTMRPTVQPTPVTCYLWSKSDLKCGCPTIVAKRRKTMSLRLNRKEGKSSYDL